MKEFLSLFVFALTLQSAQATSVVGTALHFERAAKATGGTSHFLDVFFNGNVTHHTAVKNRPSSFAIQLVAKLPARQVDRLNRLLASATPAQVVFVPSRVACFAPSSFTDTYTASNGTTFLAAGAACDGGYKVNVVPAAKTLTQVLKFLETTAHQPMPAAEIEKAIDRLLDGEPSEA